MVRQLDARGLGTASGTPPVWAWHSCGAWNCPPEREDLDMLLGGEAQPHLRLVMVNLEVPDGDCLLSYYGPWCDVIHHSVTHDGEMPGTRGLWYETGHIPEPWREQGNDRDIQACLSRLERRHILGVDDLYHPRT
ncbi:hypothetical protein [Enhygromyxa salina]|nr:hypothetical protein [Enhygromyxa salina]